MAKTTTTPEPCSELLGAVRAIPPRVVPDAQEWAHWISEDCMSEHNTPPDGHRGPGPNMIPPPLGPVTSSPGLSGAPSQVPEEAVTLQLASPQPSSAPRRGRTLLFIMLAAVLVAVAGFGSWWFLLRGGSDGESIKPVTGLDQAPQIA